MNDRFVATLIVLVLAWAGAPLSAQELSDATTEELIAFEELRSAMEAALELYFSGSRGSLLDTADAAIETLEPLGEDIVPFLANELSQERNETYDFASYALGRLRYPSAEEALRDAIRRAEADTGRRGAVHKALACWALGLHGAPDVVDLINGGNHRSAYYPIHERTTVLEAVALQTAPESVDKLLSQLDSWAADETLSDQRRYTLRALRRVADPRAVPKLLQLLRSDPDPVIRSHAAQSLSSIETAESVAGLVRALTDDELQVRRAAAFSLRWMQAEIEPAAALQLLVKRRNADIRGILYEMIVAAGTPADVEALLEHWGREDARDRWKLIEAVGELDDEAVRLLLLEALADTGQGVAAAAVRQLARSGNRAELARLQEELTTSQNRVILQWIANMAISENLSQFGPGLTRRLLDAIEQVEAGHERWETFVAGASRALVALRQTSGLAKLRKARKHVKDVSLAETLDDTIRKLEVLRENRDDVAKWSVILTAPGWKLRSLARERLVEIGGPEAALALTTAFETAPDAERAQIVLSLTTLPSAESRALVERVLMDWQFDGLDQIPIRASAAWVARSWGGEEMFDLLERSIRRRNGRDAEVLIYASQLDGRRAVSLLREYRLIRLRYLRSRRGKEQEVLDWIIRGIESGRSIERYDVPPSALKFG